MATVRKKTPAYRHYKPKHLAVVRIDGKDFYLGEFDSPASWQEYRCHLNGLAMVDGQPRFVTALGTSDTRDGWRADKPRGGCILDVASGEIITRGLSMPHSPRWHDEKLWVLESGTGSVILVDRANRPARDGCAASWLHSRLGAGRFVRLRRALENPQDIRHGRRAHRRAAR